MESDLLAEANALHIEGRLFADTIVVVFFIASSLHCIWIMITTFVFFMINFGEDDQFCLFRNRQGNLFFENGTAGCVSAKPLHET